MLGNIETLETIRTCCTKDVPLSSELRDWLASAIGRFLVHDCTDLNEAFGIMQDHGGVPWWLERAIRIRDRELREMSARFFGARSAYQRARKISELSCRYETTSWPRDRTVDGMPDHYLDTPKQHLWAAFKSGAKMPVSERRLRTLLAG